MDNTSPVYFIAMNRSAYKDNRAFFTSLDDSNRNSDGIACIGFGDLKTDISLT